MDIDKIIFQMSLEDKIALCEGANFWETRAFEKYKIPAMFVCDGPNGLRKQDLHGGTDMLGVNKSKPATCFPAAVTTANSWDTNLLQEVGKAIGEEARTQRVGVVLGPGCNIKRNPLCGRNFEYFSEDPYLSGKLAAGFIRGVESQGVGTSLKHYAANSQELSRFTSDSIMDERTLREIYLTGFEIAVKEGKPATVMCSYNKLNGIHASDHKELLTDILRTDWGFEGMVVTDWGAMNDRIEGFKAGCDWNMPGGSDYMFKECVQAVENGTLSEKDIDNSVRRILKQVFRGADTLTTPFECDYDAHHVVARQAAEQGAVLLKNQDTILPIGSDTRLAVIGTMAKDMRYQGAGSSHVNAHKLDQPIDFIPDAVYASGCDERGDTTDELIVEAVQAAKGADVAVVFAGLPAYYESEGFDRDNMKMPKGHVRMIESVAEANPNTVVVLLCGSAVECSWADKVKAILYMGLPGEAGGEAISNLLYGKVNPSGKLAESWPYAYEDVPSAEFFGTMQDALYVEGIYVGYRYYDKAVKTVRWPFGYGLSYTTFAYSDLMVEDKTVKVTVTNTGNLPGGEVVQLYMLAPQDGIHRPVRELKGFQKVFLQPGESRTVTFKPDDRSFAIWQDGWKVPGGTYGVKIADLSAEINVSGEEIDIPSWQEGSWYGSCEGKVTQKEWEAMLGKSYVPPVLKKGSFTMDNTIMEMKDYSLIMKIMFKVTELLIAKGTCGKVDYDNPEFRMMINASAGGPLRSMQISAGIKGGIIPGLLEMANGHFFKGIYRMITMKNKQKRKHIIAFSIILVVAILVGLCAGYVSDYYRADQEAIESFSPMNTVAIETLDDGTMVFKPENYTAGFIFYPGGKVEYTAYQPLMAACAEQGILCVLLEMPLNLAVLDIDAADGVQAQYPEIEDWYIGGHSLGGSMAASYLANHMNEYEGLILLGSYSTADLSATNMDILSVYGSEDQVLNHEKYDENKENLPDDFIEVVIDGGCHAYFGMYGAQDGDGEPTISNEEQIFLTAEYIVELMK